MSLQACADIVAKGDPDRFRAAITAPVEARRVLFPLYAFNVEVARAPWVASEPMIGEMRLQWWRDALEEIADGSSVRKHEVTTPLAEVLERDTALELDRSVAARRWDLHKDPFEDEEHLFSYLSETGGALMWAAALSLGAPDDAQTVVEAFGTATALVRFFEAVPELEARGRVPLLNGRLEGVEALARLMQAQCPSSSELKSVLPDAARPALREGWQTQRLLARIVREPARVSEGRVGDSEFRKRLGLLRSPF